MRITDDNFLVFCMHHYDNPHCADIKEFEEDVKRIRKLKRFFRKYELTGELDDRQIMNQMVVIYNVFGARGTDILFLKLGEYSSFMIPFMKALNYLPAYICINNRVIHLKVIETDAKVEAAVKNILRGS